jgi:hypothetical protein
MPNFLISFICCYALALAAPKGGGVKRRLEQASATETTASGSSNTASTGLSSSTSSSRTLRQRLSGTTANTEPCTASISTQDLPLVNSLRRDWAKGLLSAKKVQEYAWGAQFQGAEGLRDIAKAGTSGANPQNIQRSLINLFGQPLGAPPIDWYRIPMKVGHVFHPFLLPHKFFQAIYKDRRGDWEHFLQGPIGAAQQYWDNMKDNLYVKNHPNFPMNTWAKTLPLGLHGDAGAYSKQDSLMVISWNSLLGRGNTRRKRFLFTFLRKRDYSRETLDVCWKIFAHSMNQISEGKTASVDWQGKPMLGGGQTLADGWCGALCQCRGDWQFYCEIFQFPQWNAAERMCWLCKASSTIPHLYWTLVELGAGWRETMFTHESYLAHLAMLGLSVPILFLLVVGFRLECVTVDILHAMDQGWMAHILGNVMWETIQNKCWGASNIKDNVKLLEADMKRHYKACKVENRIQGILTSERLRAVASYPKLKCKAAAARHLAPYMLELAKRFDNTSVHDRTKIALCQLTVKFYDILKSHSQYLAQDVCDELATTTRQMAILYNSLYTEAFNMGLKLWKMTPKVHLVIHSSEVQASMWGNPMYYWTYADEDLVGLMIEIGESCHASTLTITALVKWLVIAFDNSSGSAT